MKNAAWKQLYEKSNMEIMNLENLMKITFINLMNLVVLNNIKQGKGNSGFSNIKRW